MICAQLWPRAYAFILEFRGVSDKSKGDALSLEMIEPSTVPFDVLLDVLVLYGP